MPHCVLEYSRNVHGKYTDKELLGKLHGVLMTTGLFELAKIKSRSMVYDEYYLGDGDESLSFVHLTISILSGREASARKPLGEKALALLKEAFPPEMNVKCGITVRVAEMEKEFFFRA